MDGRYYNDFQILDSFLSCCLIKKIVFTILNYFGYQATENIRQGFNHRTPIIAVTANAMKGDREKVKFDHLPPKFNPQQNRN
jgi:CheY-like chemotaxis protein